MPGPLNWSPPEPPTKNWWALIGGPLVFVVLAAWLIGSTTVPYVALLPGSADPINALLSVPKDKANPPKGSFLLTTVSLEQQVTRFDQVRSYFDSNMDLVKKKDLLGSSTPQQFTQIADQEMDDSKQNAVVVALRALGYTIAEHGDGALVTALAGDDVPAHGVLEAGDAITALDGVPTPLAADAVAVLSKHKFGDTIDAAITRADKTVVHKTIRLGSITNTTCSKTENAGARPCLGVSLATKGHRFDLPFDVKIDTSGIGGPSAGLAFTLALIDELTPGELTGGHNVAVTGTIDITGAVGPVGGVIQKTAAVRAAHARLFLVPPDEYKDAKKHAGKHLKVVAVNTLKEALDALHANGGDIPQQLALGN